MTPNSPLKSALKVPGTTGRLNPLSPTFKEEQILEKHETRTEKQNAKDLVNTTHSEADRGKQRLMLIVRLSKHEFEWPRCASASPTSAAA